MESRLPIIVLGGSDSHGSHVPEQLEAQDMLSGCKGALALPSGQTVASELLGRLQACGRFEAPILIGPRSVYEGRVDAEIVDTEGSLAVMIRTAFRVINRRYGTSQPVAVSACDILPSIEDLQTLVDDEYRPHEDSMFWWQMIACGTEDLGASSWKPSYEIRPDPHQPPQRLYPGHVVVFRPDAMRIGLASSLLELAYRYRNRELRHRWAPLLSRSLLRLIQEDLHNLGRLQWPVLTVSLPFRGLLAYWKFCRSGLTIPELETHLAHMLLHRRFHRAVGKRPLVISLSRVISLAKDIDTMQELAAAAATMTEAKGP